MTDDGSGHARSVAEQLRLAEGNGTLSDDLQETDDDQGADQSDE